MTTAACPCGGAEYTACCGRYHAGLFAPDAELLMRSRYSAYVLKLEAYLFSTWHSSTRPATLDISGDKWLGLEVRQHLITDSNHATVQFVARYKIGGRAHRLHETSRFVREDEQWFYVDGEFPNTGE